MLSSHRVFTDCTTSLSRKWSRGKNGLCVYFSRVLMKRKRSIQSNRARARIMKVVALSMVWSTLPLACVAFRSAREWVSCGSSLFVLHPTSFLPDWSKHRIRCSQWCYSDHSRTSKRPFVCKQNTEFKIGSTKSLSKGFFWILTVSNRAMNSEMFWQYPGTKSIDSNLSNTSLNFCNWGCSTESGISHLWWSFVR